MPRRLRCLGSNREEEAERFARSRGWTGLVGSCTNEPTKLLGTDGSLLGDQYIYQRGQIYTLSEVKADGTIVGNMTNPVPGIMVHSILRIPGQPGECVLSGKFPPDPNLLIYS